MVPSQEDKSMSLVDDAHLYCELQEEERWNCDHCHQSITKVNIEYDS